MVEILNQSQNRIEEDSVKKDFKKFKAFSSSLINKLLNYLPRLNKVKTLNMEKTDRSLGLPFLKDAYLKQQLFKILKIFVLVLAVLIVLYSTIALLGRFLKSLNLGKNSPQSSQNLLTPTPFNYSFYKPSVYADDASILKLEEEVNILMKEILNYSVSERNLFPPSLDFDISF